MRCPGCRGLLLQGKEGAIHFPSYSLLEKAPAARSQPTAANRCCRSRRVARHPSEIFGSFWEMVNPSPWDSPYLSARRGGREAARGSERGCPPLSSSYCCFGNWGEKKEEIILGNRRTGTAGQAQARTGPPVRDVLCQGTRLPSPHRLRISHRREDLSPVQRCQRRADRVIFNDELSCQSPTSGFGWLGRAEAGGPLGNGPRAGIEKGM